MAEVQSVTPTAAAMAALPATLQSFIETRVRRLEKAGGFDPRSLAEHFANLMQGRAVRVGGRTTCGAGKLDPTWVEFTAWNEIVRKARALGFVIEQTSLKQDNAWATKAGGFWNENQYRMAVGSDLLEC